MNRRVIIILLAVVVSTACTMPSPDREIDRKSAVRALFETGWNHGRMEAFSSTLADSVVFHYAGTPAELSRAQMGDIVRRWREAFPDLHMEVEDLIVEGDRVAARLTLSGTHEGVWRGKPPTGRRVRMALMMFFRFENGRIVELWETDDQLIRGSLANSWRSFRSDRRGVLIGGTGRLGCIFLSA